MHQAGGKAVAWWQWVWSGLACWWTGTRVAGRHVEEGLPEVQRLRRCLLDSKRGAACSWYDLCGHGCC